MYKPQTREFELQSVKIGEFYINATIKVGIADQGIGGYEFWGFKGTQHQMGIDEIEVLKAEYDDGQEDLPTMTAKEYIEQPRFDEELTEAANDAWAASEPDEGPDPDELRDRMLDR